MLALDVYCRRVRISASLAIQRDHKNWVEWEWWNVTIATGDVYLREKYRRVGNSHLWLDPEGIVAVVDEEEGINLVEGMEPETRRCRCGCRGV